MRTAIGAVLVLALGACDNAPSQPEAQPKQPAAVGKPVASPLTGDATSETETCERDAAGQVACLNEKFALELCGGAQVLGSMFRENEADGTYSFRTAYGLNADCLSELKDAARKNSFREGDKGELVAKPRTGYRETIIIGLQISQDGTVVEWERTKE
ncbi:hypothetical protein [uncultured Erythrobacter sp.]|uniref:hypothetical protein n=1 Tax=uncultured Erythrobacter sp. TaxID=263913 RepID=UPI002630C3A5|nr:hypothetical protein [uncultured Erythrobacter sp.]